MTRPAAQPTKPLLVRIPPALHDAVVAAARESGLTITAWVSSVLAQATRRERNDDE